MSTETMTEHPRPSERVDAGFTFTLTAEQFVALSTVAVAASADDVTAVITGVHLTATSDGFRAEATDRYRVAVLDLECKPGDFPAAPAGARLAIAGDGVILPADLLKVAARSAGNREQRSTASLPLVQVTVVRVVEHVGPADAGSDVVRSERVTIAHAYGAWSHTADAIRGNFPPLARLLPADGADLADIPAGTRFGSGYLAALAAIRLPGETAVFARQAAWDLSSTPWVEPYAGAPRKPTPMLAERAVNGARMRYLLQPKLKLR